MVLGILFNTEEGDWRGFILPRLQAKHTALVASLLIAVPRNLAASSVLFQQRCGVLPEPGHCRVHRLYRS